MQAQTNIIRNVFIGLGIPILLMAWKPSSDVSEPRNNDGSLTISISDQKLQIVTQEFYYDGTVGEAEYQFLVGSSESDNAIPNLFFEDLILKCKRELNKDEIIALAEASIPRFSPYDHLFRRFASEIGWDWRLLVSLSFTESNFNPKAVSHMGARGLMQILPSTGKDLGVYDLEDPIQNLKAGTKYLKQLHRTFHRIKNSRERLKFTLASYNAGRGHVSDAQRLAIKFGKNPYVWTGHTELMMLKMSQKEFYQDEVVRHGYCRGREPVNYVRKILRRFENYKTAFKENLLEPHSTSYL